jgi:hypothetical protein
MNGAAAGESAGAPTAPTRDGWAALGSDHAGAAPQAGASNAAHWRTEFVIFFVWKEWTPSDELRGQGAAATENKAP